MIKAIVFDLYGTLLDIHTDEDQALLWEKMAYLYSLNGAAYTAEELRAAYAKHVSVLIEKQSLKGVDFPDIEILKAFKNLYKYKHVKASKTMLKETAKFFRVLSLEYIKPYPGAVELLEYLKASPFKVILLSNAQESFTLDELRVTGIKHYFDAIFLSSQYKVAKPSAVFFQTMLDRCHLLPEDCLFIGNDHTTDIEGATGVGMESLYLHTNCSQMVVPEVIGAKWRVDSGSLFEVLEIVKGIDFSNQIDPVPTITETHGEPTELPEDLDSSEQ